MNALKSCSLWTFSIYGIKAEFIRQIEGIYEDIKFEIDVIFYVRFDIEFWLGKDKKVV